MTVGAGRPGVSCRPPGAAAAALMPFIQEHEGNHNESGPVNLHNGPNPYSERFKSEQLLACSALTEKNPKSKNLSLTPSRGARNAPADPSGEAETKWRPRCPVTAPSLSPFPRRAACRDRRAAAGTACARHVSRPLPPRRGARWERGGSARRERGGHFVPASLASGKGPLRARRGGKEGRRSSAVCFSA